MKIDKLLEKTIWEDGTIMEKFTNKDLLEAVIPLLRELSDILEYEKWLFDNELQNSVKNFLEYLKSLVTKER